VRLAQQVSERGLVRCGDQGVSASHTAEPSQGEAGVRFVNFYRRSSDLG
jgi:hypothetical protein